MSAKEMLDYYRMICFMAYFPMECHAWRSPCGYALQAGNPHLCQPIHACVGAAFRVPHRPPSAPSTPCRSLDFVHTYPLPPPLGSSHNPRHPSLTPFPLPAQSTRSPPSLHFPETLHQQSFCGTQAVARSHRISCKRLFDHFVPTTPPSLRLRNHLSASFQSG